MLSPVVTVVTRGGAIPEVLFAGGAGDEQSEEALDEGPNPIVPELKELAWGGGAYIVFAVLMRFVLFPRLKRGMDARYAGIRADHEAADAARLAARGEVESYERELAGVKAEAALRIDAARQQLEGERSSRLLEVNAGISERRAAAAAQADAAREAVQSQIERAVTDVAARATELATGRRAPDEVVRRAVVDAMGAGATR